MALTTDLFYIIIIIIWDFPDVSEIWTLTMQCDIGNCRGKRRQIYSTAISKEENIFLFILNAIYWSQYAVILCLSFFAICASAICNCKLQKVLFWNPNPLHTSGFKLIYTLRLLDDFLILEKKMMTIIKKIHADTWKKLTFCFLKFKSTLTESDTLYWFLYIYRLAFASS